MKVKDDDGYLQQLFPQKTMRNDYGSSVVTTTPPDSPDRRPIRIGSCYCARRYYLAICAFIGLCLIYTMRVNLSVAILYMKKNSTIQTGNVTETVVSEFHEWDTVSIGVIMGAFFYGYITSQLPGGWISCQFGGRRSLGYGAMACAILQLLTPAAARIGIYALVAVRALQGISQGLVFPSMQALWSHWAPPKEKARLSGISFSGCYYGTAMAIPFSTLLAECWGWEAIFYSAGSIAFIWSIVWLYTISDTPFADRRISEHELEYITEAAESCNSKRKPPSVPWKSILTSVPVWTIVVLHFTQNWGFYTMLTYLPTFMNQFLQFELAKTGLLAAIPYLAMGIMLTCAGMLADVIKTKTNITVLSLRKIFGSGGSFLQALFTVLAIQWKNRAFVMTFVCLIIAMAGFPFSAYSVNQLDIADAYASVLMGLSNMIATLPGMISPPIVGAIVQHGTPEEWKTVFYIIAGFYTFGALVYALFAKTDAQPWARSKQSETIEE